MALKERETEILLFKTRWCCKSIFLKASKAQFNYVFLAMYSKLNESVCCTLAASIASNRCA